MPVATTKVDTAFDHLDEDYEFHFVKKLEKDIKLDPDASPKKDSSSDPIELFDLNESHVDKQLKLNDGKAKKIRRFELDTDEIKRRNTAQQKSSFPLFRTFFILTTLSAIIFMFVGSNIRDELIQNARTEYNVLTKGKNYCTDPFVHEPTIKELREKVVGQKLAIDAIESALKDTKSFTSIILHGSSGVGKTLSSQIIKANFPWAENAQILLHNPDAKFDLTSILRKMSTYCGMNLLIIDDLYPLNIDMLNIKQALEDASKEKNFKLILVFIFNTSKDSEGQMLNEQSGHNVVEFRKLNYIDLEDCINVSQRELSVTLTEDQRKSVKAALDVNKNGCKNVRSKVNLYA